MNEVRVSILIQSHLNDARVEMRTDPDMADKRIRFAQYLIHTFPVSAEVDPQKEWDIYFRE